MLKHGAILGLLACLWLAAGCETLVTAYLINELLNDEAPAHQWSGTVRDTSGQPVSDVTVEVKAELQGDADFLRYTDTTDQDGEYSIKWRWHQDVVYKLRVVKDGVLFAEENFGHVESKDQHTDLVVQGSVSAELSGMIRDWQGDPLEGVVVVGASATALDATPSVLLDGQGETTYYVTSESGIYTLEGSVGRYGIVCAYHPDHGFAYAYAEDSDEDGSIALNINMGDSGEYTVEVQVVDGAAVPVANQVLPASRQFRLRLEQPWNLGTVVDGVVADHGLFPGLVGQPSDGHPDTTAITIQSTGDDGIADSSEELPGGVYQLKLLNVHNDDPATALVTSASPLVLHMDDVVVVRVN